MLEELPRLGITASLKGQGGRGAGEIEERQDFWASRHGDPGGQADQGFGQVDRGQEVIVRKQYRCGDRSKMPDEAHGTTHGYGYWGCRCLDCKVALCEAQEKKRRAQGSRLGNPHV